MRLPYLAPIAMFAASLQACETSREIAGSQIPKSETAAVLEQVDRDLRITDHRVGIRLIPATLREYPDVQRVLAGLSVRPNRDGYVDLGSEHATGVRSVTVTPPGFGERGARLYVVELAVTLDAVGIALARAGVLVCRDVTGAESAMHAGANVTSTTFFTSYDPSVPIPRTPNAGPAVIQADCPRLSRQTRRT